MQPVKPLIATASARPVKGTVPMQEKDRKFQGTRPPVPSRMFERDR